MSFEVQAVTADQFAAWTDTVSASGPVLDDAAYRGLLRQSQAVKPYTYHAVRGALFDDIVMQKLPPGEGPSLEN
jgi:cytochrome o ubiquinol oxidase subunit II